MLHVNECCHEKDKEYARCYNKVISKEKQEDPEV